MTAPSSPSHPAYFPASSFAQRRPGVTFVVTASDTAVLLDPKGGRYYSLNDVGHRVWGMLDGATSIDAIIELLRAEYDVTEETLRDDVQHLLAQLEAATLIQWVKG